MYSVKNKTEQVSGTFFIHEFKVTVLNDHPRTQYTPQIMHLFIILSLMWAVASKCNGTLHLMF
jgi:hypothetical protein